MSLSSIFFFLYAMSQTQGFVFYGGMGGGHRLLFEFLLGHFWNGLIRHTALSPTVLVIVNSLYARSYTICMQFRTHLLFLQTSAGTFLYFRASATSIPSVLQAFQTVYYHHYYYYHFELKDTDHVSHVFSAWGCIRSFPVPLTLHDSTRRKP